MKSDFLISQKDNNTLSIHVNVHYNYFLLILKALF